MAYTVLQGSKSEYYTYTVSNLEGMNKEHLDSIDELSAWLHKQEGNSKDYPQVKAIQDQTGKGVIYTRKASPRFGAIWIKTDCLEINA